MLSVPRKRLSQRPELPGPPDPDVQRSPPLYPERDRSLSSLRRVLRSATTRHSYPPCPVERTRSLLATRPPLSLAARPLPRYIYLSAAAHPRPSTTQP